MKWWVIPAILTAAILLRYAHLIAKTGSEVSAGILYALYTLIAIVAILAVWTIPAAFILLFNS